MLKLLLLLLMTTPAMAQDYLCGGAEPFWSLEIGSKRAHFSTPETPGLSFEIALITRATGRVWPRGFTLIGEATTGIALLNERACDDTMSDINYGYSVDYLTQDGLEPVIYTGCCRLKPTSD